MNFEQKLISPETELERRIVSSPVFEIGTALYLAGRRQKTVLTHITEILTFIDRQPWQQYREDLRLLALLHDLGKHKVLRNEIGKILGDPHSVISEHIAEEFTSDQSLLYSIRIHDKYYGFHKRNLDGHFDRRRFIKIFSPANLDLLRRFNYADSNDREKISTIWFEDEAYSLGLIKEKVYQIEPSVLTKTTSQLSHQL